MKNLVLGARRASRLALLWALTPCACGTDDDVTNVSVSELLPAPAPSGADPARGETERGEPARGEPEPTEPAVDESSGTGPVYAMMTQVYGLDDRTVYVSLSNTLDIDAVVLEDAREFPGVANLAAIQGRLLISDGDQPIIREFEITDGLEWVPGRTVSFAQFPLTDNANFYYQFILDDRTAYLPYDAFKRIVWNPSGMEIVGLKEDTSLEPTLGDLRLEAGGNRQSVRYDGPVLQSFFYTDAEYFRYGAESLVAVYDPVTHEETQVIRIPCPGSSIATKDERGYVYFSSWDFVGHFTLFGEGPAPCVARVTPELTLDADWTTDFTEQTEGRHINNFRYIGAGKALANVLHHELLNADFTAGYDFDVADRIFASGPHWRLWLFDLESQTAAPVEGIEVTLLGSGAQFAVLDGRTFVFLPFDDYGRTMVYELDAEGRANPRFEVTGDVFKWIRVR